MSAPSRCRIIVGNKGHQRTLQLQADAEGLAPDVLQVILLDNRDTIPEVAELVAASARQGLSVFIEEELGGCSDPTFLCDGAITLEEILGKVRGGLTKEEQRMIVEWKWGGLDEVGFRNGGPLVLCLDYPGITMEAILLKDMMLWKTETAIPA